METKENIWLDVLKNLKKTIDENTYDTYLKDTILGSISDSNLEVTICSPADDFIRSSIKTSLADQIEKSLFRVTKKHYKIKNVEKIGIVKEKNISAISDSFMKDSVFSGDNLMHNFNFSNYYETFANKSALLQAKALVDNFENNLFSFFPIFIHGDSGVGKSHLVNALGNEVKKKYPHLNIKYLTSKEFVTLFVDALNNSNNEIKQMSNFFENLDLLILEDFQFFSNKVKTEEQFFYIFEALHRKGAKLVLTSDVAPTALVGIEPRLLSRIESGIFIEILNPDQESRLKLVNNKIKEFSSVRFEPGVAELISQVNVQNVRSLEGWIKTLVARSMTEKRDPDGGIKITLEFAQQILKIKSSHVPKKEVTYKRILNAVCLYYHIKEEEVLGKKRTKDIALARNMSIYYIRELLGLTYKDIASIFNRKDHTTIINSCKRIKSLKKKGDILLDLENISKSMKS